MGAKWRSIRSTLGNRPVVVANGAEGEPASAKDALLCARLPHLVLDGAAVAATVLRASRVVVHVPEASVATMADAVARRQRAGLDPVAVEIVTAPDRFLSGQESAVVATVNGRAAGVPTFTGITPVRVRGVRGRPTLVQNVETLAHVALVARFGAAWFRELGTVAGPGTLLLTVSGRWPTPSVLEVPLGMRLGDVLGITSEEADPSPACSSGATAAGGSRPPRPSACPWSRRRPAPAVRRSAPGWSCSCRRAAAPWPR